VVALLVGWIVAQEIGVNAVTVHVEDNDGLVVVCAHDIDHFYHIDSGAREDSQRAFLTRYGMPER
jgi:hypothetical protein